MVGGTAPEHAISLRLKTRATGPLEELTVTNLDDSAMSQLMKRSVRPRVSLYSPGKPSNDTKGERNGECKKISDKQCIDDCVNNAAKDPSRPQYSLTNSGEASNCPQWANDILNKCRIQCKGF
jgi:hypothetical protein